MLCLSQIKWHLKCWEVAGGGHTGNGRNTVSRALLRKRELGEFCAKLGDFCEKLGKFAVAHNQGKTSWVDQSCADCPGFPVLSAGHAPPPELHPGASECALGLAFSFMPLRANSSISCPQLPYHPCENGTHRTIFLQHKGLHTDTNGWGCHAHRSVL